jgi:hypothetical protein
MGIIFHQSYKSSNAHLTPVADFMPPNDDKAKAKPDAQVGRWRKIRAAHTNGKPSPSVA